MNGRTLSILAIAAPLCLGATASFASDSRCLTASDPDGQFARLPDCVKVGRHIRVESSVSRGTATLDDGLGTTAARGDEADFGRQRVRIPDGGLFSTFFGGR